MSERPTPETDAFIERNIARGPTGWDWRVHSRRLERERDEARDTIADVLRALEAIEHEGPRLAAMRVKSERDEAREVLREFYFAVQRKFAEWAPKNNINAASEEAAK